MNIRKLTDEIFVTGQIEPSEVPIIAAEGFRTIICNRPDGEAPDQPDFQEIEAAAAAHGLEIRYLPVQSGVISDADVQAFETATRELPKPAVAYCRSGTRCTALWSLSEASRRPIEDILSSAAEAGYDMTPLLHRLEHLSKS